MVVQKDEELRHALCTRWYWSFGNTTKAVAEKMSESQLERMVAILGYNSWAELVEDATRAQDRVLPSLTLSTHQYRRK